ncbi:hypothetical protein EJ08DRAFT_593740, partial [Tothia fuscella]
ILCSLSSFVSALDLFNIALTCKANYMFILSSQRIFHVLRRQTLCDGDGLAERQAFTGPYSLGSKVSKWRGKPHIWSDEPIEVHLYNLECDEAGALPCRKCGINICEECRSYPREQPPRGESRRRPHLNADWQSENVMAFCTECDVAVEEELRGQFLHELCDCDIYERWICLKCAREEEKSSPDYYMNHTTCNDPCKTKDVGDHIDIRYFYCPRGKSVPEDMRPRCTWCRRRHLPEEEWDREWKKVGRRLPFFKNDPCYPPFIGDTCASGCDKPYPKLAYKGPTFGANERAEA